MGRGARGGRANVERGGTACRILTLEGSQRRTEEMFHESLQRAGRGVCRRRSMALLAWGSRPWLGAQGGKGVEWRSRAPMWCLGEAGPRTRDQLHPIAPVSWGCHGRQEDGKNARTAQLSCAPATPWAYFSVYVEKALTYFRRRSKRRSASTERALFSCLPAPVLDLIPD